MLLHLTFAFAGRFPAPEATFFFVLRCLVRDRPVVFEFPAGLELMVGGSRMPNRRRSEKELLLLGSYASL